MEGCRTINVAVPEEVYWHIRRCATESKASMKEFMTRFCLEAKPYRQHEDVPNPNPIEQPGTEGNGLRDAA